jgi:alanine racemase
VATVAEGVTLRAAGVTAPILKLSGAPPAEVAAAVAYGLTLTVSTPAEADAAEAAAAAQGRRVAVHLKVDTGMRRIGVEPAGAADLADHLARQPHLDLDGVFTHLAAADDPAADGFTAEQLTRFDEALAAVEARLGGPPRLVHAANSAGVLACPAAWRDLIRPGIAAYGYYPGPDTPRSVALEPVLTWVSHLSLVKAVRAGEAVSYGRTWAAAADTWIGTVPVGYGDGYARILSNRSDVLVAGTRRPVVGRVCMDQLMVDLGPDPAAAAGDPVILIGCDGTGLVDADELGTLAGTISYEVLCAVAERVPRVYVDAE